jgi:hypothetical protein
MAITYRSTSAKWPVIRLENKLNFTEDDTSLLAGCSAKTGEKKRKNVTM